MGNSKSLEAQLTFLLFEDVDTTHAREKTLFVRLPAGVRRLLKRFLVSGRWLDPKQRFSVQITHTACTTPHHRGSFLDRGQRAVYCYEFDDLKHPAIAMVDFRLSKPSSHIVNLMEIPDLQQVGLLSNGRAVTHIVPAAADQPARLTVYDIAPYLRAPNHKVTQNLASQQKHKLPELCTVTAPVRDPTAQLWIPRRRHAYPDDVLLIAGSVETAYRIDVRTGKVLTTYPQFAVSHALDLAPAATPPLLAFVATDKSAQLCDWLTGGRRVTLAGTKNPSEIRFVCQQQRVLVVERTRVSLHSLDGVAVATVALPMQLTQQGEPRPPAACVDGDLLYVSPDGERVCEYHCTPSAALTLTRTLYPAHLERTPNYIRHIRVKGGALVTVDVQGSVRIIDRASSTTAVSPPTSSSARKNARGHELDSLLPGLGPAMVYLHAGRLMCVTLMRVHMVGPIPGPAIMNAVSNTPARPVYTKEERHLVLE